MNSIKNIPLHVGIIMDGNGRWALERNLARLEGHKEGMKAVEKIVEAAIVEGIKVLTFFAFSTENWKRDKTEVYGIFDIVREYLGSSNLLMEKNIKLSVMGDYEKLPEDLVSEIKKSLAKTQSNTGMVLNLAINYGARDEIARAFNKLIEAGKTHITPKDIEKNLYSADLPELDLIIRTSGEQRLSNFMLYQSAYAELYFSKVYWPAFTAKHLKRALKNYAKRERRYGGNHK